MLDRTLKAVRSRSQVDKELLVGIPCSGTVCQILISGWGVEGHCRQAVSNLMRSAVKASAARAKGVKAIDEKHLGTHQIADQAIDVRESGGPDNN